MKLFAKLGSALLFSGSILWASAHAASPGYVDFGSFEPSKNHEFIEVDLDRSLLKIASLIADKQDPEIARLIGGIERLRVNVLGFDGEARGATMKRVESIRSGLDRAQWKRVVSVREAAEGDNVVVFIRLSDEEIIQGVVVTVVGKDNEAVLVNIVGEIDPVQLATLGERFKIDALRELKVVAAK